ncbi:MAG: NAD-dependent epimerase/dehydratase family protein [Ignavibacteriales bacterium]|nr:NAD-dependent epimerase/dehydratase family protein [Ignavibacteriales bacterium]
MPESTQKIAFVTGGTGFIGSHLVEQLLSRGYTVRCLVRDTAKPGYLRNLPVELYHGDLFSNDVLEKAVSGVDYVYHVAGVVASRSKEGFFHGNRDASKNMIEIVSRVNPSIKKFLHVSSQAAVGPSRTINPIDEKAEYHPITTYGISKMEAEKAVLAFSGKLPVTIVRPSAVYGPRDPATFDFFKTIYKGLEPVVGFHDKIVSLVHSTDLVSGIVLAGEKAEAAGEIFFISSEKRYSWIEIGNATKEVMRKKALRVRLPEPLVYAVAATAGFFSSFSQKPSVLNFEKGRDMVQDFWTCDVGKAKRMLGYKQETTLTDGIRETVSWYLKNGWM